MKTTLLRHIRQPEVRTSVARAKGLHRRTLQSEPRPGTRTWEVYDRLLVSSPENPIHFKYHHSIIHPILNSLDVFYGLDIRTSGWGPTRTYWLAPNRP